MWAAHLEQSLPLYLPVSSDSRKAALRSKSHGSSFIENEQMGV